MGQEITCWTCNYETVASAIVKAIKRLAFMPARVSRGVLGRSKKGAGSSGGVAEA